MKFWTIERGGHTVTLCETCALYATNAALFFAGYPLPAGSMAEANRLTNDLSSCSMVGECGNCGAKSEREAV